MIETCLISSMVLQLVAMALLLSASRCDIVARQIDRTLEMGVRDADLPLSRGRLLALLLRATLQHRRSRRGGLEALGRERLEQVDVVRDRKPVPQVVELCSQRLNPPFLGGNTEG